MSELPNNEFSVNINILKRNKMALLVDPYFCSCLK